LPKPFKARAKLLIVDRHFTIEYERPPGQLRDCGCWITEAAIVLDTVPAHQPDAGAVLVGEDPAAVDLL
jgi:hypothetical protein